MNYISIVFDTTGSMSPVAHEVRLRVDEVLHKLFGSIPDLMVSIVAHGDYCDGPVMYQEIPFTNDLHALAQFVRTAKNTNGGDGDEFYEFVMRQAFMMPWGSENNTLIMIGDANPHLPGYSYGRYRTDEHWRDVAGDLAKLGVKIYSVQALNNHRATDFWEEIAYITNGRKVDLHQFGDSVEMLIAAMLHSTSHEAYDEYKSSIKVNRTLAAILEGLERPAAAPGVRPVYHEVRDYYHERAPRRSEPRHSGTLRYSFSVPEGLVPVEPSRFQRVTVDRPCDIRSFVTGIGAGYTPGRGFYQLTKKETLRAQREVILVDKLSGDMFTGIEARLKLGVPMSVTRDVYPMRDADYDIYLQSTSYTRKLVGGTKFLYEVVSE